MNVDLDLARLHPRVHGLLGTRFDNAPCENHPLTSQLARTLMRLVGGFRAKDDLDETVAVAQIDKDHASVVTPAVNPSRHHNLFAHHGRADLPTAMGAALGSHSVESYALACHRLAAPPPGSDSRPAPHAHIPRRSHG